MFDESWGMRKLASARVVAVGAVLAGGLLTAASASASTTLCEKAAANGAIQGPTTVGGSTCASGFTAITLPGAAELATLSQITPHIKYQASGIDGKPTIQFTGVNVQIINGEDETNETNGEGNLVLGYDENEGKHLQTGSHNLVLGFEQTFTSFGGIVGGFDNAITAPFASVTGGSANTASGAYATVGDGYKNTASGEYSLIGGGRENKAQGGFASILGGKLAVSLGTNEAKL